MTDEYNKGARESIKRSIERADAEMERDELRKELNNFRAFVSKATLFIAAISFFAAGLKTVGLILVYSGNRPNLDAFRGVSPFIQLGVLICIPFVCLAVESWHENCR